LLGKLYAEPLRELDPAAPAAQDCPMSRLYLALFLVGVVVPAAAQSPPKQKSAQPNSFVLTLKTGSVRFADESQTVSGGDWSFDRSASSVAALEGETRVGGGTENLSLGFEALRYDTRFKPANGSGVGGTMYTRAFLAKSKYYFLPGSAWQPYVGGGFGIVQAFDYSGPLHSAEGIGYQGVVGMQLRADRIGMKVEYLGLLARLTDDEGERINLSSHGLFVGLSFYFGRR
jgi:hypothetical protein